MDKPFLRISQMIDENLVSICDVIPVAGTAMDMLVRLRRIFGSDKGPTPNGALWIELHEANEDLTDEREMIRLVHAEWLLGTFFKLPRKAWKALRVNL